jgi:hypothetical protein
MRRWLGFTLVALVFALFGAGPAASLEPGVFVDPNSPAGKEYSFPLGVLRSQGAGHRTAPADAPQPLFGIGVTPSGAAGASSAGIGSRGTRGRGHAGGAQSRGLVGVGAGNGSAGGVGAAAKPQITRAELIKLARPGSAVPLIALIAGLMLAVGMGLGAVLRRLRRTG